MRKGKIASQVAHAAVKAAVRTNRFNPALYNRWDIEGHKKVVLYVHSQDELKRLHDKITSDRIVISELIIDQGLTQIPPDSITALAIGPDHEDLIDRYTRDLPLLN